MSKVIVHLDLNAFFVRAEEIRDPSLENKAVAIGHSGRAGIVSTCSYEARKYGVHSGMPMSQAKKLCPFLIIKPVDFRFYSMLSHEFMTFVKSYTKIVEIASCDECYADFTEVIKNVDDIATYFRDLQRKLFQKTKLKCSIGVGPTKFIAKMASDFRKPNGLTIITPSHIKQFLYPLPIKDTFGIGKKTSPRLEAIGVRTIGDLANSLMNKDEQVLHILGKFSSTIEEWINGKGDDTVVTEYEDPKSIGVSSTLHEDTDNFEIIKNEFEEVCHQLELRLKKENKTGNTIQIMVKDTEFKMHNKSISLSTPTSDFKTIFEYSMKLYEKNFLGLLIRAVGVTVQNLINPQDMAIQMTFLDYEEHEKENVTKLLINKVNRRFNKPVVKRASEIKKGKSKNG